jgi:hypothetical protein
MRKQAVVVSTRSTSVATGSVSTPKGLGATSVRTVLS